MGTKSSLIKKDINLLPMHITSSNKQKGRMDFIIIIVAFVCILSVLAYYFSATQVSSLNNEKKSLAKKIEELKPAEELEIKLASAEGEIKKKVDYEALIDKSEAKIDSFLDVLEKVTPADVDVLAIGEKRDKTDVTFTVGGYGLTKNSIALFESDLRLSNFFTTVYISEIVEVPATDKTPLRYNYKMTCKMSIGGGVGE